jgi:predicted ester cyclase
MVRVETPFDVKAYAAAWSAHAVERIVDFYAEDALVLALPDPMPHRGREGARQRALDTLKGLPDLTLAVEWSAQEGNRLAALLHAAGRHAGTLDLGAGQVLEPTGQEVRFEMGLFLELDARGRIRRETQVVDAASLLMQAGVLGAAPAGATRKGPRLVRVG